MDLFSYIETNVFCIVVLVVLLVALRTSLSRLTNQTILTHVFLMIIAMLILDTVKAALNGVAFPGSDVFTGIMASIFHVISVMLYFQWLRFVGYNMQLRFWRDRRMMSLFALPGVVAIALVAGSIKFGWVWSVDENNVISHGPYYLLFVACCSVYMVFACILAGYRIPIKRYFADRVLYISLALFGLLPLLGLCCECTPSSPPYSVYAMVIAALFVFLEMQSRMISTDPLTKLNNRNQLNSFLDSKIGQYTENRKVYLFVLDLDKFKGINDNFGHSEGDSALNMVADVLKRVCGPLGCFISRFGGDEFNLVAFLANDAEADALRTSIKEDLARTSASLPYSLTVSIGYARSLGRKESVMDLFSRADEALFAEKKARE